MMVEVQALLDAGVSLHVPYKEKISDWYDPNGLSFYKRSWGGELEYVVSIRRDVLSTKDFHEAYGFFMKCCNNVGAVQARVQAAHRKLDCDDDWEEIKKLVRKEMRKIPKDRRCSKLL